MNINDHVAWRWGNGMAEGKVIQVSPERTQIISKGKTIVRNGTTDNPALVIQNAAGTKILKLLSEVQATS